MWSVTVVAWYKISYTFAKEYYIDRIDKMPYYLGLFDSHLILFIQNNHIQRSLNVKAIKLVIYLNGHHILYHCICWSSHTNVSNSKLVNMQVKRVLLFILCTCWYLIKFFECVKKPSTINFRWKCTLIRKSTFFGIIQNTKSEY